MALAAAIKANSIIACSEGGKIKKGLAIIAPD
jgi:hypothetical protein